MRKRTTNKHEWTQMIRVNRCSFVVGAHSPTFSLSHFLTFTFLLAFLAPGCDVEQSDDSVGSDAPAHSVNARLNRDGQAVNTSSGRGYNLRPDVAQHMNRGYSYFEDGKYNPAIGEYEKAIALDPTNPFLRANLGSLYVSLDRKEEATKAYLKAVELEPNNPLYRYNLGVVCLEMDDYPASQEQFEAVDRIAKNFREIHLFLGQTYGKQKLYRQAERELRRAVARQPNIAETYYQLGLVYEWQNKLDEAAAEYRKGITAEPENYTCRYRFGVVLKRQGKTEESQKQLAEFKRLYDKYVKDYDEKSRARKEAAMQRTKQDPQEKDNAAFGDYFGTMKEYE